VRQAAPGACPICGMALEPVAPHADGHDDPELRDMTRRLVACSVPSAVLLVLAMAEMLPGRPVAHALPHGVRVAYEALSWGRTINEFPDAWDAVAEADCPNLGIGIDSFHILATKTGLEQIEDLDPLKIYLVQLSDFMWQETRSPEERIATARHFRVFPGEGVHSGQIADLVVRLHELGYRGDFSFEVFNDDYQQLPLPVVAERARRSAVWLAEDVLRRSTPVRDQMRLKRVARTQ